MTYIRTAGQKQHLNLSDAAERIVESDQYIFRFKSRSAFLNHVFQNYYELADASVSAALNRKRLELEALFCAVPDTATKEAMIEQLLQQERSRILERVRNYQKGCGFKFHLSGENAGLLLNGAFPDEAVYQRPMRYFKAVIEEYAEKSFLEREAIVYQQLLQTLQNCIDSELFLCVTTGGTRYEVKPYRIMSDSESLYHYLVGISSPADASGEEPKIASFLVSRITGVRCYARSHRSGHITERERERIQEKLKKEGVSFLIGSEEEITVRLSDEGMQRFNQLIHLRPVPCSAEQTADGTVLVFRCTRHQAKKYFFPFGSEAEILSPEALRAEFAADYQRAAERYRQGAEERKSEQEETATVSLS